MIYKRLPSDSGAPFLSARTVVSHIKKLQLQRLLLALLVIVISTIIVATYANTSIKTGPKISFTVQYLTNSGTGKMAVIGVTNSEHFPVSMTGWQMELEGPREYLGPTSWPSGTNLSGHSGCLLSMKFPTPSWPGPPGGRRWRVVCMVRANSWFDKLRMRAASLPRVGRWIGAPAEHPIASELFSP